MGVFDAFRNIVGQTIGGGNEGAPAGGVHQALTDAIEGASAGGMTGFMAKLQDGGLGGVLSSWTGGGQALPLSGDQLRAALGDEHIENIASRLGVQPDQALSFLQQHLPALAAFKRPADQ
jgi:uncharacterized protein YidB (DUF937 family)